MRKIISGGNVGVMAPCSLKRVLRVEAPHKCTIGRVVQLERTKKREIASGGNMGVMAPRASKSVLRVVDPAQVHNRICCAIKAHEDKGDVEVRKYACTCKSVHEFSCVHVRV